MSGPLGFGAGGGGGDAVREVIAGSGITTSGTATSITVVNDGVRSLSGSGISVSSATGAVTITAPTVSGGTGISVSGSGTTALTVSATGVNSVTAGTGISVSGTTALTVTNSGVTSIVAGTNVTVSGATGAVTINAPAFATPGSSAIGDTAAAGTATTVSRSDHVHGREAAGTPGASAVGDTAAAGSATTVARSDHRHSREAFGTPVNIDASLTSLSAGSLTTVARADHVHTVSNLGGGVIIASTTLASAAASITFSSIPQTYKNLRIVTAIKSAYTGGNVSYLWVRFNSDTSASYPNSEQGVTTSPYTGAFVGVIQTSSTNSTASFSTCDVYIYDYASITNQKWMLSRNVANAPTTSTNYQMTDNSRAIAWISTSAITSIVLSDLSNAANFVADSRATLYGFN